MSMQANCNCTGDQQLLSLNGEKNTQEHTYTQTLAGRTTQKELRW